MASEHWTRRLAHKASFIFPLGLLLLVVAAVVLTLRFGNPLGHATGVSSFKASTRSGMVSIATLDSSRQAQRIAVWADEYLTAVAGQIGIKPHPVTIRLLPNRRAYEAYAAKHILGYQPGMDFCYYPAQRCVYGYMASMSTMRPRLQHEMFHALVDNSPLDGLPLWLEEGTAELCEGFLLDDGALEYRQVQKKRMYAVAKQAENGSLPQPSQLAAMSRKQFYGGDAGMNYSIAYSFALLLYHQQQLPPTLAGPTSFIDPQVYRWFLGDRKAWYGKADFSLATGSQPAGQQRYLWVVQTRALGNN